MRIRLALLGLMVAASCPGAMAQTKFSSAVSSPVAVPQPSSRFAITALPPVGSLSRFEDLFAVVSQEDTPFFSEIRLPFGELHAGRIECAAFERDIAMRNLFLGLPDSTLAREMTAGTRTPRGDQLYGLRISFRLSASSLSSGARSQNPLKTLLSAFR